MKSRQVLIASLVSLLLVAGLSAGPARADDQKALPTASASLEYAELDGEPVDLVDDVFELLGTIDETIPAILDGQEDGPKIGTNCSANANSPGFDGFRITYGGSYSCGGVQQSMTVEWCLLIKDGPAYRPYACTGLVAVDAKEISATWGFPCNPGWHRYKARVRGASTSSGGSPNSDDDRTPGRNQPGVRYYCRPSISPP